MQVPTGYYSPENFKSDEDQKQLFMEALETGHFEWIERAVLIIGINRGFISMESVTNLDCRPGIYLTNFLRAVNQLNLELKVVPR